MKAVQPPPSEAEIITANKLPDQHCSRCHEAAATMSTLLIAQRLVQVCCAVSSNYHLAVARKAQERPDGKA